MTRALTHNHPRPRLYLLVVRDDTGLLTRLITLVSIIIAVLYANRVLITETAKAIISIADFINAVLDSCQVVYEATAGAFTAPYPWVSGVG